MAGQRNLITGWNNLSRLPKPADCLSSCIFCLAKPADTRPECHRALDYLPHFSICTVSTHFIPSSSYYYTSPPPLYKSDNSKFPSMHSLESWRTTNRLLVSTIKSTLILITSYSREYNANSFVPLNSISNLVNPFPGYPFPKIFGVAWGGLISTLITCSRN